MLVWEDLRQVGHVHRLEDGVEVWRLVALGDEGAAELVACNKAKFDIFLRHEVGKTLALLVV